MRSQNSQTFKGLTWIINFFTDKAFKTADHFPQTFKLRPQEHWRSIILKHQSISLISPLCPCTAAAVTFSSLQYDCKHLTLASKHLTLALEGLLAAQSSTVYKQATSCTEQHSIFIFSFSAARSMDSDSVMRLWTWWPIHFDKSTIILWAWPTVFVFNSRAPPILATLGGNASKQRKQWNPAGVEWSYCLGYSILSN